MGGMPQGMVGGQGGMPGMTMGGMPQQDPPVEYALSLTLEELYKGTSKKMRISRTVVDSSGQARRMEETLQVDVKPGWKNRTRITFAEKGALCCSPV
jgi:DnaJ family protein B protein 4